MSRDIDQEVSETLCTLLSFDEDNFLTQEEVEETLRNCPNLGNHSTTIDDTDYYQDYDNSKGAETGNDDIPHDIGPSDAQKHENLELEENKEQTSEPAPASKPAEEPMEIGEFTETPVSATAAAAVDCSSSNLSNLIDVIKTEFNSVSEQIAAKYLEPAKHTKTAADGPKSEKTNEQQQMDVKLEFTCESEKITEEQLANVDFFEEDEYKKDLNFNYDVSQVEIGCTNDICDKERDENAVTDFFDNSISYQSTVEQTNASIGEPILNADNDHEISSIIMSDHNYTTQEKTTNAENLHKLLVNHILNKGSQSSSTSVKSIKAVTDFVDQMVENINLFRTHNQVQIDSIESQPNDSEKKLDIFPIGKSSNMTVFDDELMNLSKKEFKDHDANNTDTKELTNAGQNAQTDYIVTDAEGDVKKEIKNESNLQEDILFANISVSSLASPKANCSEPLEHVERESDVLSVGSSKSHEIASVSTELNDTIITPPATEISQEAHSDKDTSDMLEVKSTTVESETCENTQMTLKETQEVTATVLQEEEAKSSPNETASDLKIAKMSVFDEKLAQMADENDKEICDDLDTTEEYPDNDDSSKVASMDDISDELTKEKDNLKSNANISESAAKDCDGNFNVMNIASIASPPEYCSEPLEHTTFDEAFDLKCNEKSTVINHLDSLKLFAQSLREDCETFTSSTTTIESKLQKYMQEKLEIFKRIAQAATGFSFEEKGIQTDERVSKSKLRKHNQNNKKILLDPTDSCSSSSDFSSISDDGNASAKKLQRNRLRSKRRSVGNSAQLDTATQFIGGGENEIKKESIAADYDDGVALVDYTQSEVFETETFCSDTFTHIRKINKSDSLSDDGMESDTVVDDTWQRSNKSGSSNATALRKSCQNESDKENSAGKAVVSNGKQPQDEGDKEIERLINLNGLIKRPPVGTSKSAEGNEKARTKSANCKNKDILASFTEDELQAEIFSDPSFSESEEEIITETQFLKRCNENVKQQLLSDSSSDSNEEDVSDNIEEILSSNEGSDSPLVERFLKKFNANDTDDEDDEDDMEKCDSSNIKPTGKSQEKSDIMDATMDKNKSTNSSENSDCEMLDDMFTTTTITRPNNKSKSLEKMLSVVEKRKKMSRLCDSISLSSESESSASSDVEAVEESKSRIKPMLRPEQLAGVTREAQRNEAERIRRLERKHKTLTKLLKERPDVQEDCNLILDYIEESKTFIKVHPDIVKHLKQHQREGVRFMYDSCYGGIEALKKSSGSGCILAHCMGLGKTLQLIALLHTVISYKELKTNKVLVLCPKSTVMNWADEIERWLGPLKPKYYTFNDTSDINDKIQILKVWSSATTSAAGILLIGYEAFRTLVFYHSYKNRGIPQSRLDSIRNDVDKYLLSPGADLVVCDEGHIIKNSKSAISLAVSQIKTPKRIVLTGTPIQNNLKEYYSMVNFIKPLFLGTEKEFANLYANPIKNGQHKDSSKRDIQVMKQRSFVLHKKLSKFVQRKEAELLKTFLPQKYEYVLFIPMTKVQTVLYERILSIISKKDDRGKGLITDYTCLRKIWTHPKVLEDAWINATAQKHRKDSSRKTPAVVHSDDDQPDDVYDSQTGVISVTNDWWRTLLSEKDLETILPSNKFRTMFEILRMCEEKGEKCLIFSAFVAVLNVVEYFFKKMNDKDPETLNELKMSQGYQVKNSWILGKDYYRLDGKTPKLIRHKMIEQFNSVSNKRARVFLISSRAGGQGINLTGANRVIILDTSWNPSNDQQNIFRVFRLGQKKNCYIYRLIAMGTMEERVYSRSVTKQAMSFRVVDEQQIDRHYSMSELTELYSLTVPDYANRPMPDCPQDSILASLLLSYPNLVYKYHEHDSLLENKVEQELSEQEKQDAWAAYERDQQLNSEIREMPNPDDIQNNVSAPKFPSYLGSLSAFSQMSALFNYPNFSPAALSPYLPYLPHLGNYSATNQQYLEMRKRLADSTTSPFPYPDISTSLGSTTFGASPFAQTPPPPKSMSSTNPLLNPDLSAMHSNALHTNPLSALSDLNLFGLGGSATNNHMAAALQQQQQQQQRQHSSPTSYGAPTNNHPSVTAAAAAAAAAAANFDYQMYENSLKSLVNYRHDFSGNANKSSKGMGNIAPSSSKPATPTSTPTPPTSISQFQKSLYSQTRPALNSPTPRTTPEQHQQQQKYTTDKNAGKASSPDMPLPLNISKSAFGQAGGNSSGSARSSPQLAHMGSNKRTYNDVNITSVTSKANEEHRATSNQKSSLQKDIHHNSGGGSGAGGLPSYQQSSFKNSGNNLYTKKDLSSNAATTTTSDNMNRNNSNNNNNHKSAMQIIPTTSPPGTSSITNKFTDIAPSISLTAVPPTNAAGASNQTKNLTKTSANNKMPTTNKNGNNSNNNNLTDSIKNPSSTPYIHPVKLFEMNKKQQQQQNQQPQPNRVISSKSNILPTKLTKAVTSESLTKSSAAATSSSTATSQSSNAAQQKQKPSELGVKLLTAIRNVRNKNLAANSTTKNKQQNLSLQQQTTTAMANTSNSNNNASNNPARTVAATTISAVKSANSTPKPTTAPTTTTASKTLQMQKKQQQQQQGDLRKVRAPSLEKRQSPNITTHTQASSSTPSASKSSSGGQQAQKAPTSASTSSSALKIQSTNKPPSASSSNDNMLTYILETCINQKKFAIGNPTKGGGGTTVTRVQTQGNKRKNTESIPKDAGSNEAKRAK